MTTAGIVEVDNGLRGQLTTVLSLYQVLTNLHFLLVEQRASTSTLSTRSILAPQLAQFTELVQTGLKQLSQRHQQRLQSLNVFSSTEQGGWAPSSAEVSHGLEALDEIMAELVMRARKHVQNQARINELVTVIQGQDEGLKAMIKKLSLLRDRCQRLVQLGQEEVQSMERSEKHPIPYNEILNYARKLSQTTTAPPGFKLQLEEEEGGEAAEESEQPASKAIYQGEAADANQGKAGQIPAHLQDKLPFPSVHAMRRSAMQTPLTTWDAFKRGFQTGEEDVQQQQQQQTEAVVNRQAPIDAVRPKATAEDEDDGFGLDLN